MSIVRKGETGVDFSWSKPPAARLLELGYSFVVSYISVPPASAGKNIGKTQIDGYLAAGLKVLLVWEMSATTPDQGAPRGAIDGYHARRLSEARQMPYDVPILAAVDTNTTHITIDAHEGYLRAFAEACAPYPIGVYGDTDILARVRDICRIGWVPNAWSWSGVGSRRQQDEKAEQVGAHVLQRLGYHIDGLWAVDPNVAIRDFPAWGLAQEPPVEKPDQPAEPLPTVVVGADVGAVTGGDMLTIIGQRPEVELGKRWLWNGIVRFATTEAQANALVARGACGAGAGSRLDNPVWLSEEEIARIPLVKVGQ